MNLSSTTASLSLGSKLFDEDFHKISPSFQSLKRWQCLRNTFECHVSGLYSQCVFTPPPGPSKVQNQHKMPQIKCAIVNHCGNNNDNFPPWNSLLISWHTCKTCLHVSIENFLTHIQGNAIEKQGVFCGIVSTFQVRYRETWPPPTPKSTNCQLTLECLVERFLSPSPLSQEVTQWEF